MTDQPITISVVGDISFTGSIISLPFPSVFQQVKNIFKNSDLVIGNLEGPLTLCTEGLRGKCTLRGDPGWAQILKNVGFNLLSLANNHLMDYGPEGLFDTIKSLDSAGIKHIGSGNNQNKANTPLFLNIKSYNLAILARSSVIVSSPCYAGPAKPGVAFLDKQELIEQIQFCRSRVDLVMVILHWGLEDYRYPSPTQVNLAKDLILAGADILIGHHPHVLQGIHRFNGKLIAYSLGNFLFNEFNWRNGTSGREMKFTLSEANRKGMILQITWNKDNQPQYCPVFTRINEDACVSRDDDPKRVDEFNDLCKELERPFYSWWWRLYACKREWELRLKPVVNLKRLVKNFRKLRLHHFMELVHLFRKSINISSEKSTNPYE